MSRNCRDRPCATVPGPAAVSGGRGKRRRLRWTLQKQPTLRKLLIYKDRPSVKQDNAAWARKFPGDDGLRCERVQVDEAGSPSEPAYGALRPRIHVVTADLE